MKTTRTRPLPPDAVGATVLLVGLPAAAWWAVRGGPAWLAMWAVAFAEFAAVKVFTLGRAGHAGSGRRALAYLALWPGLNARDFVGGHAAPERWTRGRVAAGALANGALGAGLLGWALHHLADAPPLLAGWMGMTGMIFLLHFGAFRLVAWAWCRAGVAAPPIMRNPIAAISVAEFWGERWNLAFAETARRHVFRPVARRAGAKAAGLLVFLLSGLIHESVISLPARGGWGGPTVYFLLQAAGIAVEKSAAGRWLGLGHGGAGRAWTFLVTAGPAPLLFHPPFIERVILPMLRTLVPLLP